MSLDSPIREKLAFALLKGAPVQLLNELRSRGITLSSFFSYSAQRLASEIPANLPAVFSESARAEALALADREIQFMERHNIRALFYGEQDYPWRLIDIHNAPKALFLLGQADLNAEHSVSIVGTRKPTPYGISFTSSFVKELGEYFPDLSVISGLAYGIDAAAHRAALENSLTTVAVVAHGLDMIYPAAHRSLATDIVRKGGAIVSEYPSTTKPYRGYFLERNRIVACVPQAVVVAESDIRGGAMSTANDAFSYDRDLFAVPGRVGDQLSSGCNHLIRTHKANLLTSAADLIEITGWRPLGVRVDARQRCLFHDLEGDQKTIYDVLRMEREPASLDRLHLLTRLPVAKIMAALSEMEFDSVVVRHPGNRFSHMT